MQNIERVNDTLQDLRGLRVQLHIDDFGTGYSSLSYLSRLRIDSLKIDHSFVRAMAPSGEDYEIVRTIINLAHNLGMDVVAEGVETAEHTRLLRDLGCEYAQGYFFSRPLEASAAEDLLRRNPSW
jgi:EAL domain-containing protein (putative c-di-GMP-specific phosphodiesterase class I)